MAGASIEGLSFVWLFAACVMVSVTMGMVGVTLWVAGVFGFGYL